MHTSTKEPSSNAVRTVAALAMLATLAGCTCGKSAGGPDYKGMRIGGPDAVQVIPNSPGPHPHISTVVIHSGNSRIDASKATVGPGPDVNSIVVQFETQDNFRPTATVKPPPQP